MKNIIFWDMTPCSPSSFNRHFGGTYRLQLQGRRNKFSKNQKAKKWPACWTYFFDPEDGGDMFLRNVGWNSTDYTASYPRRWYLALDLCAKYNSFGFTNMEVGCGCCPLQAAFSLGLHFNTEDRGDMFPRNIGWLSTDCSALYCRRHNSL
jgi:hypothetical protein